MSRDVPGAVPATPRGGKQGAERQEHAVAPGTAGKLGAALATREGITAAAPEGTVAADS
jgi:hypothetical protein